jgi:hypothetical protein
MVFVLTGVVHQSNARRFTFESGRNASDRARIVVDVDLELARKYGIPLQELPLLCLHLLEGRNEAEGRTRGAGEMLEFAESEMIDYANRRIEANASAERKRRARRTPKSNLVGQAWRTAGK